ncbi:hypothetical protein [uncultured Methanofollis sp.]|uniref:hypothetical protein n=1 Tax=uncultured Methanofollis sp. TaxID=262500 RepID=UPI00262E9D82|nr:hypothetical protein [uncultured Methanofollis sp.]
MVRKWNHSILAATHRYPFLAPFMKNMPYICHGVTLTLTGPRKAGAVSYQDENLDLQPGDWVEVKPFEEISVTLDENGRHKGLFFMRGMDKFCGQRFRVFKRVEKIMLETTGEMRKIMTPTVFLEGALCDGTAYDGCDRSCFCYWREVWLRRVPPPP